MSQNEPSANQNDRLLNQKESSANQNDRLLNQIEPLAIQNDRLLNQIEPLAIQNDKLYNLCYAEQSPLGLTPFIEKSSQKHFKVRSTDTDLGVIFKAELAKNQAQYQVTVLRTLEKIS